MLEGKARVVCMYLDSVPFVLILPHPTNYCLALLSRTGV